MLAGIVTGLALAAVGLGIVWLNDGRSQIVEKAMIFLFSIPAFISFKLKSSNPLMTVFCFIYWAVVGGVVGWLIGAGKRETKLAAVVMLAGLLVTHWVAYLKLMAEINAIGRALEALFGATR